MSRGFDEDNPEYPEEDFELDDRWNDPDADDVWYEEEDEEDGDLIEWDW